MPLPRLIEHVRPLRKQARGSSTRWATGAHRRGGRYGYFSGTILLHLAGNPQAILGAEDERAPLSVVHGAPLRLRVEAQLGFKMVKWIKGIEFEADTWDVGMGLGMGGWREDQQFHADAAGI